MTPNRRREQIVEWVEEQGACSYDELARRLNVCNMTIRRDVEKLSANKAVIKVPCGILRATAAPDMYESNLQDRMSANREQKRVIARKAFEMIDQRQTVFLDGGSTTIELARFLSNHAGNLTVVTNSFPVCRALGGNRHIEILFIGGEYDPASLSCVGNTAEELSGRFFPDKAFFSTKGFIPSEGMYESSLGLFKIKQVITQQSEQVILLADQSKFGRRALCKVLDVSSLDVVVTDVSPNESDTVFLAQANVRILVAPRDDAPNQEVLAHAT